MPCLGLGAKQELATVKWRDFLQDCESKFQNLNLFFSLNQNKENIRKYYKQTTTANATRASKTNGLMKYRQ